MNAEMPFTVNEYHDLVRLLGEHPEWQAGGRAELLRRLGYTAFGAVGGEAVLESAANRAKELGVTVALDGRVKSWGALGDVRYTP